MNRWRSFQARMVVVVFALVALLGMAGNIVEAQGSAAGTKPGLPWLAWITIMCGVC